MAEDKQNERLGEWLQLIVPTFQLSSDALAKFNTPQMRSVWRHLQKHVFPVQSIQTIRKNLLLSNLKKQNIVPGKFGNFKIETVKELSFLQNISATREEMNCVKDESIRIDKKLLLSNISLLKKINEKECMFYKLRETEDKTSLLKLKLARVIKNLIKLDEKLYIAQTVMIPKKSNSYHDLNQYTSIVEKYVSTPKPDTDNNCDEIIETTFTFPAEAIFNGILRARNKAFKVIVDACKLTLDGSTDVSKFSEKLANTEILTFPNHLNKLRRHIITNQVEIEKCDKQIKENSDMLNKEKENLTRLTEDICLEYNTSFKNDEDENMNVLDCLNEIINGLMSAKKSEKLIELRDDLQEKCSEFDCLQWEVSSLGEQENEIYKKVEKKVVQFNDLIITVCNSTANDVKARVVQDSTKEVSNFFTDLKCFKDQESDDIFQSCKNLIERELSTFQKAPLIALSRRWEESQQLLPHSVIQDLSKNPPLLSLLYLSQPKSILKVILEEVIWSQSSNHI